MIKIRKFLTVFLCAMLCFSTLFSAFAATSDTKITVSNHTAMPGDAVTINIAISNNPGIMAMAFCITYDSDALVYKNYSKGYLTSYTVKDHSDKGHVAFVNVENNDVATNGTIISLLFEVKKNAKPGKHAITLANSNRDKHGLKLHNSFSNSKQEFILPVVAAGGVTVQETCENAGHQYGEWQVVHEADCTSAGLKSRTCVRCQNVDEDEIPITHDFEADWTVDKAATPEEDGEMSRHCTKCDEVTDKITFKYEEIGGDDTSSDNNSSSDVSDSNSSNDNTLDENSSENTSADNNTTSTPSSNNQSSQNTNKKPVINNTVGEKVPLSEAEKFNDYQQNIKPNLTPDSDINSSGNDASNVENSSQTASNSSDVTTGVIENDNDTSSSATPQEPSFFSTPTGIIMAVIFSLLSVGIVVLGVMLIIRNKKQ